MADKTEKITLLASIGSVISGTLASLCCIGPLVFVILGLSGAALFTTFEQYRWHFGAVALGFLALGFLVTYGGEKECSPGTSCAISPRKRKVNKIILWIAAILVVSLIFSPNIIEFFLT
jgi:mercuric ion transport protein